MSLFSAADLCITPQEPARFPDWSRRRIVRLLVHTGSVASIVGATVVFSRGLGQRLSDLFNSDQ